MKYTSILLALLLIGTFGIVIWNMYLPISSSASNEFANYIGYSAKKVYGKSPYLKDGITSISSSLEAGSKVQALNVGSRLLYNNYNVNNEIQPIDVTLTFYVDYPHQQNLLSLLDLLQEHQVNKAVFFVEKAYLKDHYFAAKRIQDQGYTIKTWDNPNGFNATGYSPTVYRGVPLDENQLLSYVGGKDVDAVRFVRVALSHFDSSVVAFSPQIMNHQTILEDMLKQNQKGIIFTDSPAKLSAAEAVLGLPENDERIPTSSPLILISSSTGANSSLSLSATQVANGDWTMTSLSKAYPATVSYSREQSAYIVSKPLIMGTDTTLDISMQRVLLNAQTGSKATPSYLEIRGKASIVNSTVTAWNPTIARPETDPYIPRPYIVVRNGGHLDIVNSTVMQLGYSIGGLQNTQYAHAAIEYYDAKNFLIANSTFAFNYYGIYLQDSHDFKMINNQVYGQTGYGINLDSRSSNFVVDSNNIHDNDDFGIGCSQLCSDAKIAHNVVEYNSEGIGLNWLSNSSMIRDNLVRYNQDYGIVIQKQSYNNTVENNTVVGNQYGIGILGGSSGNIVTNNIVADNMVDRFKVDAVSQGNTLSSNRFVYAPP